MERRGANTHVEWTGQRFERWLKETRSLIEQLPQLDQRLYRQIRMLLLALARGVEAATRARRQGPMAGEVPPPIRIYTLGRFFIERDGTPLAFSHKLPKRPLELLKAVIAHGGHAVMREEISENLWPDADGATALQTFHVTLHRLRQILGMHEAVKFHNGQVSLNRRCCWVDIWAFEQTIDALDSERNIGRDVDEAGIERFDKTLDLYQGPFLMPHAESWVIPLREKLRAKFIRSVRAYAEHCERIGQAELAARIYERAIEIDPQAEELYRRLMACNAMLGRTPEALAVFHRCQHALRSYLGVEPGHDTIRLYYALLKESVPSESGDIHELNNPETRELLAGKYVNP
jgi:DNA-binding SARP family transcriptional activator